MYANLKKRYGQNFLIDKNITNKIVNLISLEGLNILEIGPGDGRLTKEIINKKPSHFKIIEIDKDLIKDLNLKFSKYQFVEIVNDNFLDLEIQNKFDLVISNLPYNISSQILVKLALLKNTPDKLILMFQREFGQRLLEKKINALNSLVQCFYKIEFCFNVSKNSFKPVPKVESSVLMFSKRDRKLIYENEIDNFIKFKRYLFSHKRKSLGNLLKQYKFDNKFDLSLRVEDLELSTLLKIFRDINF